jgi:hypothetical protein
MDWSGSGPLRKKLEVRQRHVPFTLGAMGAREGFKEGRAMTGQGRLAVLVL